MLTQCGPPSPLSKVLKIHVSGYPIEWITHQETARLLTNQDVAYSFEDTASDIVRLRGGMSSLTGMTSYLDIPPIIAVHTHNATDRILNFDDYTLHDDLIFRRDDMQCAYCGGDVKALKLDKIAPGERKKARSAVATKDHIIPQSRNGGDTWDNLVTACAPCNSHKADRTPDEANMPLLRKPYKPNRHEYLALTNRHMLESQYEYLVRLFSKNSRHAIIRKFNAA